MNESKRKDGAQVMAALDELRNTDDVGKFEPTHLRMWKQRKVDSVSRKSVPDTVVYWAALMDPDGVGYTGCSDKSWNDAVANAQDRFSEARVKKGLLK